MILSYIVAGAGFNLAGWLSYIYQQYKGLSQSSPTSWAASLVIVIFAAIIQYHYAGWSSLFYLVGVLCCAAVFLGSLRNSWQWQKIDLLPLGTALIVAPLLYFYPWYAEIALAIFYLISYGYFLFNLTQQRGREGLTPWLLWLTGAMVMAFSLPHKEISDELLIVTNMVCWGSVLAYSFFSGWIARAGIAQQINKADNY